MGAITFDTLKFVKKLEAAGLPAIEAEAIAEAQSDAFGEMMKVHELATKTDLMEMKFDLLKWIVGLALAQFGLMIGILMKLS